MNYTREVFTSKDEWLHHRKIGGSSAASIIGVSPYQTKLQLYEKIVCGAKEHKDNERTKYGRSCEGLLRLMFELDNPKLKVITPLEYELYTRKDKSYMTATIDGTIVRDNGTKGILEIKTHLVTSKEDAELWNKEIPPLHYYIQCLHYLLVLDDYEFFTLYAKIDYKDYSIIKSWTIERSAVKKDLEILEKLEDEFWNENILKEIVPTIKIKF